MTDPSEVAASRRIVDNRPAQRYELEIDGNVVGVVVYREADDVVSLIHVEVVPELRGTGVSAPFLDDVIDLIAARGRRIRPICSYAVTHVAESPRLHHLVAER